MQANDIPLGEFAPVGQETGQRDPAANRLDRLFKPDSVAIVGASQKGGFARDILRNLKNWAFSGKLAAVNPRYRQIEGVPCFTSLTEIPYPVDLAVISIPSDAVPSVLEDCAAAHVGAIQIISSGFSEARADGIAKQTRLVEWAARTGIAVVGPNCIGLLNAANGLIAVPNQFQTMKAGGISAALQSGILVSSLLMPLLARGIGIGRVVTSGNEACIDVADFIDYFVGDEDTRVIACYCEQIKRPLEFIKACERAADNGKPIVMIKVGRSEGARKAALCHTGSLVGSDVAIDAVLKKLGVVRVDTIDELIETTAALSSAKRPRGRRVAFVSWSGGAISMACDVAERCGIKFPPLPAALKARLDDVVPEFGSVGNPLDLTGQSFYDTQIIQESLGALASSDAYDVVVWGTSFPSPLDMRSTAGQALERAVEVAPEVIFPVLSFASGHFHNHPDPQSAILDHKVDFDGMPLLQGMGTGLKALSALIAYAEFLRARKPGNCFSGQWGRRSARYPEAVQIVRDAAGDILTELECERLLALYDIPVTRATLAGRRDEVSPIAQDLTFPVTVKVQSPGRLHEKDIGGGVLNIRSPEEAAAAFELIAASVRSRRPEAKMAGVVVESTAGTGPEMTLGVVFDPQFGPVTVLGLPGDWIEPHENVRVLLPPFDAADVQAAIGQQLALAVPRRTPDRTKANLSGLADTIVRFGTLCSDLADEIENIEINPFILAANGAGPTIVDCLIIRRSSEEMDERSSKERRAGSNTPA